MRFAATQKGAIGAKSAPSEIAEEPQQIAIRIGDGKLAIADFRVVVAIPALF